MFRTLTGAQWRTRMSDIGLCITHRPTLCIEASSATASILLSTREGFYSGGSRPMSAIFPCGLLL